MNHGANWSGTETRIACIRGENADPSLHAQTYFVERDWSHRTAMVWHDWSSDADTLEQLRDCSGVVLKGFDLADIESLFRLRALQLLNGEAGLQVPCVAFISGSESERQPVPGLRHRILASWPFRSLLCVADGKDKEWLESEDIPVLACSQAEELGLVDLLFHEAALVARTAADQEIGIQIQPMWGRCGSSTAFANEIDCLLDRGLFTIRIYIDHERRYGETTQRYLARILPQNLLDTGPCLDTIACAPPLRDEIFDAMPYRRWNGKSTRRVRLAGFLAWLGRTTGSKRNEYDGFVETVRRRSLCRVQDDVVASLASRAKVAIVNHAINIEFAARVCPDAELVLDTHDYLTRGAVERARGGSGRKAFPDCATLRRHAHLESRLWKAADVCTTVSESEAARISRHAANCLLVLPEPYTRPWRDPGEGAKWDILVVADNHFFNIESVSWFLEDIVSPDLRLRASRIAIAGKIRESLEFKWVRRLPGVNWLGFVSDLDQLRLESKITVCPDRAGTGISVKVLTALAAGQAIVATSASLRGFPPNLLNVIPVFDTATAMARDIRQLLDNASARELRRECVVRGYKSLQGSASFEAAIACGQVRGEETRQARQWLKTEFGGGVPGSQRNNIERSVQVPAG